MSPRVTGAIGAAVALSLLLSSCGIIRDLTQEPPSETAAPTDESTQAAPPNPHQELPFTRQGRMFVEGGDDVTFEVTVDRLESNSEYLMLEISQNILEPLPGTVTGQSAPVRLVDPVSGEVLRLLTDPGNADEPFGTYFIEGDPYMPTHEGLPTTFRRYLPAPSQDVEYLTFTGSGVGHVPGVPVTTVDEFTPAPEPNAHEYINENFEQLKELPDQIWYPDNAPDPGLDTSGRTQTMESFVDSPDASTTRAGDQEVIALHSDTMFDVDESDPTDAAAQTIRRAAHSLRQNLGSDVREITVIGHTDGQGDDSYNQTLSEERAESVRALLEEELGSEFTFVTEGRGSTELLATEGGADDEQARARNRRVEFAYTVPMTDTDTEEGGEGLDSARRHVGAPAAFFEEMDPFTTTTHNDVDLNVYPLVRDGAYLFQMVGFENSTLSDLEADLDTGDALIPGSPSRYTEGTLGGFRLQEPDSGLVRYVIRIRTGGGEYEDFADEIHTLAPGEEYLALAVFPAPAADVTEMTLHAGAFGEIADVPVR